MEQLYVVGQNKGRSEKEGKVIWEFQGIFDDENKAIKACKLSNYFYFPIELNKELPDETFVAPNVIYPLMRS